MKLIFQLLIEQPIHFLEDTPELIAQSGQGEYVQGSAGQYKHEGPNNKGELNLNRD